MRGGLVQRLRFNQKTANPPLALTFLVLLAFTPCPACADDPGPDATPRQRFGQLFASLRQQAPDLLPGLPLARALRDPAAWAQNQLEDTKAVLGLDGMDNSAADSKTGQTSFIQPIAALIAPPQATDTEALWLSPTYHHKGMLPFHDALMLGFGARETLLDRRLSVDLLPSYGQNWVSARGYYGAQMTVGINPDGGPKPWGKIGLGFTQGDSALMDHGHGFNLHSEWNISNHFTLNAGVRSSEAMRADNFVLMRWNLLGN